MAGAGREEFPARWRRHGRGAGVLRLHNGRLDKPHHAVVCGKAKGGTMESTISGPDRWLIPPQLRCALSGLRGAVYAGQSSHSFAFPRSCGVHRPSPYILPRLNCSPAFPWPAACASHRSAHAQMSFKILESTPAVAGTRSSQPLRLPHVPSLPFLEAWPAVPAGQEGAVRGAGLQTAKRAKLPPAVRENGWIRIS